MIKVLAPWVLAMTLIALWAPSGLAQTPSAPAPDPKAILESLERAFVSVAERVMPAVVHIDAAQK